MSAEANYFKIGAFILSALIIAVVALVELGGGEWFKKVTYWETYFDESVQGLSVGSPVKYRGVQIGTVESIVFVGDVYGPELSKEDLSRYGRYVLVRTRANPPAPHLTEEESEATVGSMITAGLRVRLASQGITGLVYLEGDYLDPTQHPALQVPWTPRVPYVPSAPSTVSILSAALQNIARDLEQADIHKITRDFDSLVLEVTRVVKDAKVQTLSSQAGQALAEFQGLAQDTRRLVQSREVKTIIADAARTVERTRDMIMDWSQVTKQVKIAADTFPETSGRIANSARRVDTLLANKSHDVEETLENLRVVSENLRELTHNVKRYTAQVFLGEPPPRAGSTKR
jgi:phospholipid/cholesterol/gamma-HCH transport system substrate-binding protein/paraquat-inducible protein B